MARLGFPVTGVDASERNIGTASAHAAEQGPGRSTIAPATAEELLAEGAGPFDVVLNMEVIEHVADPGEFLRTCARLLKPGGLMIVATLNRTLKALALAKIGAEYVLRWVPAGTHDWTQVPQARRTARLPGLRAGPGWRARSASAYNPLTGRWSRSADTDVNYMMTVTKDWRDGFVAVELLAVMTRPGPIRIRHAEVVEGHPRTGENCASAELAETVEAVVQETLERERALKADDREARYAKVASAPAWRGSQGSAPGRSEVLTDADLYDEEGLPK